MPAKLDELLHDIQRRLATRDSGCWLWPFAQSSAGYGQVWRNRRVEYCHRVAYEVVVGPIPNGMDLDHFVCDTPACFNPYHVRPATRAANVMRGSSPVARNVGKQTCPQGHPYSHVSAEGSRLCRTCIRAKNRRAYQRRKMVENSIAR